jgi:hypothetical protein
LKRTPYQRLKDRAWETFSQYIRLRDCLLTTGTKTHGKCISCGDTFPFEKLQAGHFVPGRTNNILFDEEIVHSQCSYCNNALEGNHHNYRKAILDLYGKGYDEVLEQRRFVIRKKFTEEELKTMIADWKKRMESFI